MPQSEVLEIYENMGYLTQSFQKIMRIGGTLMNEGNLGKVTNLNDVCFKCGKPYHFIRDCSVHKGETRNVSSPEETRTKVGTRSMTCQAEEELLIML